MNSKTVYLRLWTPDKRYVCLVKNRPEQLPKGHYKDWGWGLVGGGQKEQDLKDYGRDARKAIGGVEAPEYCLHEIATALRELKEETNLTPDKIQMIDPTSRKAEPRGEDHEVVVYDALYYTNDISAGLQPNDPKSQITEARWVDCIDLMHGKVDDLKIYKAHLRILNDEPNPHCAY